MFKMTIASLVLIPLLAAAQPMTRGEAREFGGDRFAAGSSVRVERAVSGDLLAAGGQVDVGAEVGGDAIVTGGTVRIGSRVSKSVYAAGGQVTLGAEVADNVRAAGGDVTLSRGARVGGNVSVAGGQVESAGAVGGYLQAAGGEVRIDGPVGGDAMVTAGRVEIGPQARIAGRLRIATREEPLIDPAAQIAGGVERMPWRASAMPGEQTMRRVGRGAGWLWTVGLMVLAAALVGLMPTFFARVAATVRGRPGWSALAGFIALICIPVAAVLMMITLIGLPLGLVTLFAYLALLPVGYVTAAIVFGDWLLARARPAASSTGVQMLVAALAVLLLALLARVPLVGGVVIAAALLIGIGGLMLQFRRAAPAV